MLNRNNILIFFYNGRHDQNFSISTIVTSYRVNGIKLDAEGIFSISRDYYAVTHTPAKCFIVALLTRKNVNCATRAKNALRKKNAIIVIRN